MGYFLAFVNWTTLFGRWSAWFQTSGFNVQKAKRSTDVPTAVTKCFFAFWRATFCFTTIGDETYSEPSMGCEHSCIARPIHSQPDAEVRLIAFLPPLASRVPLITNRRGKKCFLRIFSEQWQLHRTCLYRTRAMLHLDHSFAKCSRGQNQIMNATLRIFAKNAWFPLHKRVGGTRWCSRPIQLHFRGGGLAMVLSIGTRRKRSSSEVYDLMTTRRWGNVVLRAWTRDGIYMPVGSWMRAKYFACLLRCSTNITTYDGLRASWTYVNKCMRAGCIKFVRNHINSEIPRVWLCWEVTLRNRQDYDTKQRHVTPCCQNKILKVGTHKLVSEIREHLLFSLLWSSLPNTRGVYTFCTSVS